LSTKCASEKKIENQLKLVTLRLAYLIAVVHSNKTFGSVCRKFKLILHRNTDVLSTDFRAVAMSDENKQLPVDIEAEFYHGYEQCEFSLLITLLLCY